MILCNSSSANLKKPVRTFSNYFAFLAGTSVKLKASLPIENIRTGFSGRGGAVAQNHPARHQRGIKVWLASWNWMLTTQLGAILRRNRKSSLHESGGAVRPSSGPDQSRNSSESLKALIDTYPEAEGYFLTRGEMYSRA